MRSDPHYSLHKEVQVPRRPGMAESGHPAIGIAGPGLWGRIYPAIGIAGARVVGPDLSGHKDCSVG